MDENINDEKPEFFGEAKTDETAVRELYERIEALEAKNEKLSESIELLKNLPRFITKTTEDKDGFSSIRAAFRKK